VDDTTPTDPLRLTIGDRVALERRIDASLLAQSVANLRANRRLAIVAWIAVSVSSASLIVQLARMIILGGIR
jgi:hypothetical protein